MLNETNLEKRLIDIEQAIADLQTKINDQSLSNIKHNKYRHMLKWKYILIINF